MSLHLDDDFAALIKAATAPQPKMHACARVAKVRPAPDFAAGPIAFLNPPSPEPIVPRNRVA